MFGGSGRNRVAEGDINVTPVFNLTDLLVPPAVGQNHLAEGVDLSTGASN